MNTESIVIMSIVAVLAAGLGYFISRSKAAHAISRLQQQNDQQQLNFLELEKAHAEQLQNVETISHEFTESEKTLALVQQQAESSEQQLRNAQTSISQIQKKTEQLQVSLSEKEQSLSSVQASLNAEQKNIVDKSNELEMVRGELKQAQITLASLQTDNAELRTSQQEKEEHFKQQLKQFNDQKIELKKEFENLANKIFEDKGKTFTENNKQSLDALLNPFKEQLEAFRKRVDEVHTHQTEGNATLKTELGKLHELNQRITDEAANLTKALRNDKKVQGNWGEIQVEMILDQSGLRKGQEYDREANLKDDDRKNWRPDFIVNLPEGKHIIIDSKVSLNAYTDFVTAETDEEREVAIKQHVQSVRTHINALSEKDYSNLKGINSPDFVFMFMPIEPAFLAAFQHDQTLFNSAFEKRIVVVTPTTLLATLRTIANLWSIERQNQSSRTLADQASKVYDKLRVFVEKMDRLGNQLSTAQKTYDEAHNSLTGSRSLTSTVQKFVDLGVRVKKELPASVVESSLLDDDAINEVEQLAKPISVENI